MRQKRILMKAMTVLAMTVLAMTVLATAVLFTASTRAQNAPAENAAPTPDNAVMITVFLKHDQSRPLGELNAQLEKQGYWGAYRTEFYPTYDYKAVGIANHDKAQ